MVVKELTGQLMAGIRTFRLSSAQCPCQASGSCPVVMLIVGSPLLKCLVGPIQKEGLEMGLFCSFFKRVGIESRRPMTWSCLAKEFEMSSKPMA